MKNAPLVAKILAVLGVVLAWLPIAIALVALALGRGGRSLIVLWYYPAALGPVAIVGGICLLAAAWLLRNRRGCVLWTLIVAAAFWILAGFTATWTGLASGATQEGGWESALVVAMYVVYELATIVLGAGGVAMLRDERAGRDASARAE